MLIAQRLDNVSGNVMKNDMKKILGLSTFCLFLVACGSQLTKEQQTEYNYYISLKIHLEMNLLDEELLTKKIDQSEYDIRARKISRYYSARYYNASQYIYGHSAPVEESYTLSPKRDTGIARKTYMIENHEPEASGAVSRSIKSRSYMSF